MLSNHLQNGMETAKLVWSRLPNSEDGETDEAGLLKKSEGNGVESLDYEVIENYAYREEQAQRGKFYMGYYIVVKWFFALLIGIDIRTRRRSHDNHELLTASSWPKTEWI